MVVPVSIVISTYNRATTLARTLLSLRYLRYTNFEILVVNGPSTDDTEKVLRANQDLIKVVSCPVRNLSTSRNLGINASSGEIIALIDDDAIPEPDWLDMIVTGFDDDQVASVGGFIRDNSGVSFQAKYIVSDLWGQSAGFETLEQADCDEAPGSERFGRDAAADGLDVALLANFVREVKLTGRQILRTDAADADYRVFLHIAP